MKTFTIPTQVSRVTQVLHDSGYEAYLVGGCVRDALMERPQKDWDIATNATPEEMLAIFEKAALKAVYENSFGTVQVIFEEEPLDSPVREIQVTTYRSEADYSDNRHPTIVKFETDLSKDLARRDFTMNAIAFDPIKNSIFDPYGGQKDIQSKVVRAVGSPEERFREDALRIMRFVRFIAQLGFTGNAETVNAAQKYANTIENISKERIRDELCKIISSDRPAIGMMFLVKLGAMKHIIPELLEGDGCEQKGEHVYDVMNHLLHALQHAADKGYTFHVRLSALLHDIGKPRTRRWDGSKAGGAGKYTFYGHEVVGAKMAKNILENLKFSRETVEKVSTYVRWHMFFSDPEKISLSAVRRLIRNVGTENIWELMKVRECDRVGMKKAETPYRLRKYFAMIEEVLHDPIDVKMLAIDGETLKNQLHMKPGPEMGWILHALLEEVIEDPEKNTEMFLVKRASELLELPKKDLKELGEKGKEVKAEKEAEIVEMLHVKHRVSTKKSQ